MNCRDALVKLPWQILTCESETGCRKKLDRRAHDRGVVDTMGHIHWNGFGRPARVRGLYRFLRMVALATHRPWRNEPKWLQLYHEHTFASKTMKQYFHRASRVEWSAGDRAKSWSKGYGTAGYLGNEWFAYRDWVVSGLRVLKEEGRPFYVRRPVTKEEIDAWVDMRYNGITYSAICARYNRSTKVVWTHLKSRGMTG